MKKCILLLLFDFIELVMNNLLDVFVNIVFGLEKMFIIRKEIVEKEEMIIVYFGLFLVLLLLCLILVRSNILLGYSMLFIIFSIICFR